MSNTKKSSLDIFLEKHNFEEIADKEIDEKIEFRIQNTLEKILTYKNSHLFIKDIHKHLKDPKEIDSYNKLPIHMDLNTLQRKVLKKSYNTIREFLIDFDIIFNNIYSCTKDDQLLKTTTSFKASSYSAILVNLFKGKKNRNKPYIEGSKRRGKNNYDDDDDDEYIKKKKKRKNSDNNSIKKRKKNKKNKKKKRDKISDDFDFTNITIKKYLNYSNNNNENLKKLPNSNNFNEKITDDEDEILSIGKPIDLKEDDDEEIEEEDFIDEDEYSETQSSIASVHNEFIKKVLNLDNHIYIKVIKYIIKNYKNLYDSLNNCVYLDNLNDYQKDDINDYINNLISKFEKKKEEYNNIHIIYEK